MAKKLSNNQNTNNIVAPLPSNELGKLPPQVLDLEEDVLGALMLESGALEKVSDVLRPECFYKPEHQHLYRAILSLAITNKPIDMHTVTEQLRHEGKLEDAGGAYKIVLLTSKVFSAAHIEYHARIIMQKYLARELIRISTDIQQKAYDEKNDVDELMQEAESLLFGIAQQNLKKDAEQINPIIELARERIKTVYEDREKVAGVKSGFHSLDKITSGWQNSDLIIIAARPAMGKTAFVLSMAKNMAVDFKIPVAFFSLEMSNIQLVNRLIMNVCELDGDKMKSGNLEQIEMERLENRITQLIDAPIYVDDTPSLSVFELRSKARRLVREHQISIIIIDYLQLMNASGVHTTNREQEVSMISRSLKALAKELNIPIIALSQLNRGVENRSGVEGKRPQLSDLRESGAIEQDADIVCFIHRPEYYKITEENGESLLGLAEIIVAKHRNGATDLVKLKFKNIYARFMNRDDLTADEQAAFGGESGYTSFKSNISKTKLNENDFYNESQQAAIPNNYDLTPF